MRPFLVALALLAPVCALAKGPPQCKGTRIFHDPETTHDVYKNQGWFPALIGFGLTWRAELKEGVAHLILELPAEGVRKDVLEAWHPIHVALTDDTVVELKTWSEIKPTQAAEGSRIYTIWIADLPIQPEQLPLFAKGVTLIQTELFGRDVTWPALKSKLTPTLQCFAALTPPPPPEPEPEPEPAPAP